MLTGAWISATECSRWRDVRLHPRSNATGRWRDRLLSLPPLTALLAMLRTSGRRRCGRAPYRAGKARKGMDGSRTRAASPAATVSLARTTPSTPDLNGGSVSADDSRCRLRPARKRSMRTQGVRKPVSSMIAVGPSSISAPSGSRSRSRPAPRPRRAYPAGNAKWRRVQCPVAANLSCRNSNITGKLQLLTQRSDLLYASCFPYRSSSQ